MCRISPSSLGPGSGSQPRGQVPGFREQTQLLARYLQRGSERAMPLRACPPGRIAPLKAWQACLHARVNSERMILAVDKFLLEKGPPSFEAGHHLVHDRGDFALQL